jgi:hypothetical protein
MAAPIMSAVQVAALRNARVVFRNYAQLRYCSD